MDARPVLWGLALALGIGAIIGALRAVFDLTVGLLAVCAIGGWLLGSAARPRRMVALGWGALAWLGGLFAGWLVSLAILQGSTRNLPDRLAATPFLDWLGPQLSLLDALELALLAGVAWLTARGGQHPEGS